MKLNITFSPKKVFCQQESFNQEEFLAGVNNELNDINFLNEEPPPEIPKHLYYTPPILKIKKLASNIGEKLHSLADEFSFEDADVFKILVEKELNFHLENQTSQIITNSENSQIITNVFENIFHHSKCTRIPSDQYSANNVLYIVSFFSAKSSNIEVKRQITQSFLALGSNTIKELAQHFICPLCYLSAKTAGTHCSPSILEISGKAYYDIDNGFDVKLKDMIKKINSYGIFTSTSGCSHFINFSGCFAIHFNSNEENLFPYELYGKGSHPPNCYRCHQRPGIVACRESLDKESQYYFFCSQCYKSDKEAYENNYSEIMNLKDIFYEIKH